MSKFAANPVNFSVDCARQNGQCVIVRENILFLDDGEEHNAINHLQQKCGYVVIMPDTSGKGRAWLYHTSCKRMADVISQIFQNNLKAPESLPLPASEMMVGELHRRCVTISYDDCKAKVKSFSF